MIANQFKISTPYAIHETTTKNQGSKYWLQMVIGIWMTQYSTPILENNPLMNLKQVQTRVNHK
jgi:hypothetical protein